MVGGGLLSTVPMDDPLERRNARLVQLVCALVLVICSVTEIVHFVTGAASWRIGFVVGCGANVTLILACAMALRLVSRGRLRGAVSLLTGTTTALFALILVVAGAHFEIDVLRGFPPILAVTALLLGRRALWAVFGVITAGIGVGSLRDAGVLGPAPSLPTHAPALGAVGQTYFGFLVLFLVLDRFGGALRDALRAALDRGKELERAGAQLAVETAQKSRAQAALMNAQKLEVAGRLSAGLAHDFNNLLTIILSGVELARDGLPPEHPARGELDSIGEAASRAARLTRQLLTFARRQVTAPEVVAVDEVVRRFVPLIERFVGARVKVQTSLGTAGRCVRIDPAQIEQLLMNLAANARDAIPRGGTLRITTDASSAGGGSKLVLRVTDDGVGMDAETQARVFEPFFTTKDLGRGTGIGMTTCREIVTQAGGEIAVESAPGKGTTVSISLPEIAPESAVVGIAKPTSAAGGMVLVVEDDPQLRTMMVGAIEQLGYRVFSAGDGNAGMALAAQHRGDLQLVVTDVVMPGALSGRELASRVRRDSPVTKVLLTSSHGDELESPRESADPGLHVLAKPFTPTSLSAKVRDVLEA